MATVECVLLLSNVFSHIQVCKAKMEEVMAAVAAKVDVALAAGMYYRMCSLTIECVLLPLKSM